MSRWIKPIACAAARPRGDLEADAQHLRHLQRPGRFELLLQGLPGDVLHDQVRDRLVLDGVDGDDVLMADGRGRPRSRTNRLRAVEVVGQVRAT